MTDRERDLAEGVRYVRGELDAIHVAAEGRALDESEQARWDEGMTFIRDSERTLARLREVREAAQIEERLEDGDAQPPQHLRVVEPFDGSDVTTLRPAEARDRALKVLEDRDSVGHLEARQVEALDKLIRSRTGNSDGGKIARRLLITEDPHYRTAFQKLVTNPSPVLTAEESRAVLAWEEYRAMSIGTDTAGGFGVPVLIDPTIILTGQGHPNDFFAISRVETITNDEWKGVSSAGVTWSFDAEAAEVSDDSPTLAQPNVPVHKAQGFIPYSIEVGQDYPGFADEMSTLLREGYSELLVDKFTTGTGTNQPTGIVTALDANTNVEVLPTTDGAFGSVDVYKVWDALPIKYRPMARWMSSTDVQNEVRQFGTSDSHQFTINLTQEAIPRLFGREYHLNDYMDDFTATTGKANLLIVGDFRNFLIAQRAGMQIELVQHLFATANNLPSGQRGWYAWARVGSDSINDLGFRILQNQ